MKNSLLFTIVVLVFAGCLDEADERDTITLDYCAPHILRTTTDTSTGLIQWNPERPTAELEDPCCKDSACDTVGIRFTIPMGETASVSVLDSNELVL